jgi:hypothetical protein
MKSKHELFTNFLESVKDSDPTLIESIQSAFNILHEAIDPNNMGWDSHLARSQERAYAGDEDDEWAWETAEAKYGDLVGWTKMDGRVIPVFQSGYGMPEYVAGEWDADEDGKSWSGPSITGVESGEATQVDGRWMTGDYPVFNTEEEASQFDEDSI